MPSSWCSDVRSEEHTSELQSHDNLVCRLLLEKKKIPDADEAAKPLAGPVWTLPSRCRHLHTPATSEATPPLPRATYTCACDFFFFFYKRHAPPQLLPFFPPRFFPI